MLIIAAVRKATRQLRNRCPIEGRVPPDPWSQGGIKKYLFIFLTERNIHTSLIHAVRSSASGIIVLSERFRNKLSITAKNLRWWMALGGKVPKKKKKKKSCGPYSVKFLGSGRAMSCLSLSSSPCVKKRAAVHVACGIPTRIPLECWN